MVHLHNGILHSGKTGAPTLCDSMDGSGEYYAKGNKSRGERQMPYDLTYKQLVVFEKEYILNIQPHQERGKKGRKEKNHLVLHCMDLEIKEADGVGVQGGSNYSPNVISCQSSTCCYYLCSESDMLSLSKSKSCFSKTLLM